MKSLGGVPGFLISERAHGGATGLDAAIKHWLYQLLGLLRAHGKLNDRLELSEIVVLNLAAVEGKVMFKDDVQSGAAGEFRFGSASKEHGGQSRGCADARANAKSLYSVGNGANSRTSSCRLRDRTDVLALAARAGDFAFGIHGLFAAGIGASRGSVQTNRVAVRQD